MPLTILPLTLERMNDLDTVFQSHGCSVAKNCYCMCYRKSGRSDELDAGETRASKNRTAMAKLAAGETPPGLFGYKDGKLRRGGAAQADAAIVRLRSARDRKAGA